LYTEVLVFACNWGGWSCIETASNLGLHYPASVKVVRVSCLARVHAGLILKAFEFGADGVMLLGCEQGKCHFGADSFLPKAKTEKETIDNSEEFAAKRQNIINEYEKTRSILEMLGVRTGRLVLVQLPAFDGRGFVMQVVNLIAEIDKIQASKQARIMGPKPTQDIKVQSHSQY